MANTLSPAEMDKFDSCNMGALKADDSKTAMSVLSSLAINFALYSRLSESIMEIFFRITNHMGIGDDTVFIVQNKP